MSQAISTIRAWSDSCTPPTGSSTEHPTSWTTTPARASEAPASTSSREFHRTEARAQAALLLHDMFLRHRQESRQRYVGPFKERIEELGRIVFNSSFSVEIDEDLSVARRTLDGDTLEVGQQAERPPRRAHHDPITTPMSVPTPAPTPAPVPESPKTAPTAAPMPAPEPAPMPIQAPSGR